MSGDPGQTLGFVDLEVPDTPAAPLETGFDLGETLGQGGMAVVRRGLQRSLDREVAIKSTREPSVHQGRLVAEGRITGALEHPNIVPVHDVVRDRDGALHIVLKHVDGVPWADVLRDPSAVHERFGIDDLETWNLDVLEAVCRAVEFAHAHGVLHRDLKPDNVMVGAFGQVYVVDWGVAVRTADLRSDPTAHRRIVGTPRYMAPELAAGDPARQGPATDVYLLGAVLYELVTGMGPHRGLGVKAILEGIPSFRVALPDHDAALVDLLARAMAPDPGDRFGTVGDFLRALRAWRRDRAARTLLRQAVLGWEALRDLLSHEAADRVEVYQAFGAVRFGFEEARRLAPDIADDTLRDALVALARWEVAHGMDAAAEALVADIEAPEDLRAAIAACRGEREARARRLVDLERDLDPQIGRRSRAWVLVGLALFWTTTPGVNLLLGTPLPTSLALLAVIGALVYRLRHRLTATQRNRVLVGLVSAAILTDVLFSAAPAAHGVDRKLSGLMLTGANAGLSLAAAVLVDRRYALATVSMVTTWLLYDRIYPYSPLGSTANALVVSIVTLVAFGVRPSDFRRR
ncbi:MAG: serine/threonine protein kinase [Myxococcales bacterium]|nr:serine/threonine protein kinase [Myxococcales bacterium]